MRVTSRASATRSDGKAIDDPAMAAFDMTSTQFTAEFTARRKGLPPSALVS